MFLNIGTRAIKGSVQKKQAGVFKVANICSFLKEKSVYIPGLKIPYQKGTRYL